LQRKVYLAFDDYIEDTQSAYSSTELNSELGAYDAFVLQVVTDDVVGATAITVQLETSSDGRRWTSKNVVPEVNLAPLATGTTNNAQGYDPGTLASGGALVRLRLQIFNALGGPVRAHVKIYCHAGEAVGPFQPNHLGGCILWLRADLGITLNGGNVTRWADQSLEQNDAVQPPALSTRQPVYNPLQINGRPTVFFDASTTGSEKYMTLTKSLAGYSASHVFLVTKNVNALPPVPVHSGLWNLGTSGQSAHFPFTGDGNIYDDGGGTVRYNCGAPVVSLANPVVYEVENGTSWTNRLNGATQFSSAFNTVGLSSAPEIGANVGIAVYYDGYWCDMFMYNRILTTPERQLVVGYLNSLYGLGGI
jgi:hypothetical protein